MKEISIFLFVEEKHQLIQIINNFILEGFNHHFNNSGRGKGVAIYFKENFAVTSVYSRELVQITKLSSKGMDIIGVYRSDGQSKTDLANLLEDMITPSKNTIVCGDFNICYRRDQNNVISTKLINLGFQQLVNEPTHISGSQIDHLYVRKNQSISNVETFYSSVYYSDHDAIGVCLEFNDI